MGELRPLEDMADDVNMGDFVRVKLNLGLSEYRGYVWWTPKEHGKTLQMTAYDILTLKKNPAEGTILCTAKDPKWIEDNKERFLAAYKDQILIYADDDIFLAALDPYGKTEKDVLRSKVQVVGINLEKGTLGGEVAEGYEVLERAKCQD